MRNIIVWLLLSLLTIGTLMADPGNQTSVNSPSPASAPANPIQIIEPEENAHLPALSSTFVCGSAPADGKLSINGTPMPVYPGGGFLAMVNLAPGKFHIKARTSIW